MSDRLGKTLGVALGLVVLTVAVFSEVRHFAFVSWDDPAYVVENTHVRAGLTWAGAWWALTTGEGFYWHPLTWLSHMLDVQWFELDAGRHHVTNLVIHVAASLACFLALRRLTKASWASVLVAALFAIHPLRVESVAWIAERKDLLAGLCWMVTLWAYARYSERTTVARYAWVCVAFVAGLMSKPMVVTLPVVLLLLDWWPLGRFADARARRWLLIEKLPLFALSLASAGVTVLNQSQAGALRDTGSFPIGLRLANAIVSVTLYLWKAVWPVRLAGFYPYPASIPWFEVAGACLLAVGLSLVSWWQRRQRPYLAVGWAWFLITLLPVSGIVQVGEQALADRFSYIPLVGVFVAAAWLLIEGAASLAARRVVTVAAVAVVGVLAIVAHAQVETWRDSRSLWEQAARVTEGNHRAHANLALLAEAAGRMDDAIEQWRQVAAILPQSADTRLRLGSRLAQAGRVEEAAEQFAEVTRLRPTFADGWDSLGQVQLRLQRAADAASSFEQANRLAPDRADYATNYGVALDQAGRTPEAMAAFEAAIRIRADYAGGHANLGAVLGRLGRLEDAVRELGEAVRLDPSLAGPRFQLALSCAQLGRLTDAVREGLEAVRLAPGRADWHYNIAVWLDRLGDGARATEQFEVAAQLDPRRFPAVSGTRLEAGALGERRQGQGTPGSLRPRH